MILVLEKLILIIILLINIMLAIKNLLNPPDFQRGNFYNSIEDEKKNLLTSSSRKIAKILNNSR